MQQCYFLKVCLPVFSTMTKELTVESVTTRKQNIGSGKPIPEMYTIYQLLLFFTLNKYLLSIYCVFTVVF